jgi:hypothetical protein
MREKMDDYSLDYLISKFDIDSKTFQEEKKIYFEENGKQMPYSDFDLPNALSCICKHIKCLGEK